MGQEKSKKPVLVVDDDPKHLQLLGLKLSQGGYRVITAQSADQALDALKLEKPGIVLLDLLMPDMNGFELLKILKDHYPDIPVVVVTSVWDEQEARKVIDAGAYEYVTKPIDYDYLETVILTKLFPGE